MRNKFHTLNITTNCFFNRPIYTNNSLKIINTKKTKKIKSFSPSTNNTTMFDPYEEYVSKLEFYNPDLVKTKKQTLYNLNTSPEFPNLIKHSSSKFNNIKNSRNFIQEIALKKNVFEKKSEEMECTKYENKLENLNYENRLERERKDLVSKITKLKSLMNSLSQELSETISEIENINVELEFLKNYKSYTLLDVNLRKKIDEDEKKQKEKKQSSANLNNTNSETNKESLKEIEYEKEMNIKMKMQIILNNKSKQVKSYINKANENLNNLQNKKKNILLKLDACEKDLKDFKEKLLDLKNDLLVHYHKLLSEGKDTRKEGLCWIIKAIWNLKSNVVMSYLPKFLDEKSVIFLFLYASKLIEINNVNYKIEKLNEKMKQRWSKVNKQINISLTKLKINRNLKNKNNNKNKNKSYNNISNIKKKSNLIIENNSLNESISDIEKKSKSRKNSIKIEINDNDEKLATNNNINNKEFNKTNKNNNFGDTFKTSLYNTLNDDSENKKSRKNFFLNNDKKHLKKHNTNLQNYCTLGKSFKKSFLKNGFANKEYSGISFEKPIKIKDFENINNFKVIENIDTPYLNMFNFHKDLESKLQKLKNEAKQMQKNELDRISRCFYLEDYGGKYNVDQKIVIGALIGEDNIRLELMREEKQKKNYFKTIEELRNFQKFKKG